MVQGSVGVHQEPRTVSADHLIDLTYSQATTSPGRGA